MVVSKCRGILFRGLLIDWDDVVVDVGCGPGEACALAGLVGAEAIGLDCEPLAIARLDEKMKEFPARAYRGIVTDCDPIPLPDETASVVVCCEVLEHVDDPAKLMAELARIGQPGARYLISVPDPASEALMRIVAPRWYFEKPIHQHVHERDALDALVHDAGLEVDRRELSGFFFSIWWVLRMLAGVEHKFVPVESDIPMLEHWDATWNAMLELPRGRQVAEALDGLLPKSQVIYARKPGRSPARASSFRELSWRKSRLKRLLRDGSVHVAGFDLRWSIRRTHPVPDRD